MPSGGGSAGGGGGGGGGFGGGGGWSRSSVGRYSFRSRSYGTSSGSSEDCDCTCKSCNLATCLLYLVVISVFILFGAAVIGIPVGVGVASQRPKSDIATNFYSPGDSRLIHLSSFFCERVHFSIKSKATGAAFFLVDSAPPLTDRNNFTINSNDTLSMNDSFYHFWQYHLHPNSSMTMNVCTDCSRVILDIYVIKGNENINRWGDDPGRNYTEVSQNVSDVCPIKSSLMYTAVEEDEYYFIIHNTFDRLVLYYDVTLQVERFEYESPPTDVNSTAQDYCAISSGGNCALEIPYSTGSQRVLVVTTIPENVDWSENIDIQISCSRRHWAYAVVVLVPLFVVAAGIVVIVLLIWHCCCSEFDNYKKQGR